MFQWLRLHSSNPGGLSETPGQGIRSHMLQLRVCMPELNARIQHVATETKTKKTKIMASNLITSWPIDEETMETVTDFIFLDSKIPADNDFSHEINRCSLEEKL